MRLSDASIGPGVVRACGFLRRQIKFVTDPWVTSVMEVTFGRDAFRIGSGKSEGDCNAVLLWIEEKRCGKLPQSGI